MVVISETAGAVKELGETVIVNPNDEQAIAEGNKNRVRNAERRANNEEIRLLHKRLQFYNVNHWADEFLNTLLQLNRILLRNVKI